MCSGAGAAMEWKEESVNMAVDGDGVPPTLTVTARLDFIHGFTLHEFGRHPP